ncbi:outer membrane beta-barrel protein [[Haemophilus] ducreyi]|uniref:outer membrane beta-barrel protein n=1 Tax=Haemophilus ducreyi TaxID=730 RepID=UPI0006564861|nr:outer membrane beta-barrel protein [[Haemophilus] ducreyi]AKO45238.1 hypothetical protein RZ66_02915 [[Haemophilus] ducreyi]AKO46640.1 hypothetical protein RZ67_02895 [[Haemophilus] ducreyi]OOS04056.1 hypothetical protein B0190_04125 [[Haemophilus] ducreyi]SEV79385.1 Outer membrane protein beta-barrel domain-containing protein [[Haemophilus] ducreyi]VEG82509.1 Uncharacterised protein [[Haemophilus] ducreyi]
MKIGSLVLALSAMPVLATASVGDINLYTKVGTDISSRFEAFKISHLAKSALPTNRGKPSLNLFLEPTYSLTDTTEVGLGIGYVNRKGQNYVGQQEFLRNAWEVLNRDQSNGADIHKIDKVIVKEEYKVNRYSSIPLYVTLKQNFPLIHGVQLYLKGDVGFAFNKSKDTAYHFLSTLIGKDIQSPNGKERFDALVKTKLNHGLYYGIALGAQYKNLLAEVGYYRTDAKIAYNLNKLSLLTQTLELLPTLQQKKTSYKNDAIRLSVGFRF